MRADDWCATCQSHHPEGTPCPAPGRGTPSPRRNRTATMAELRVTSEASLQGAVTQLGAWLGIWAWHDADSRRNKAGLPDLLLIGTQGILWRELKTATGRLRPAQDDVAKRLRAAGADWDVWRPADWRSGRIRTELEAIR